MPKTQPTEPDAARAERPDANDEPILFARLEWVGRWKRLAAIAAIVLVALLSIGVWRWALPGPVATDRPLELSAAVRFGQEIKKVLDGEQRQLYVADYVVDDAMLGMLPIETLRRAKQNAMAIKDNPPAVDEDKSEVPVYDAAGKRVNFDPPAWQDYPQLDTVLIDQGIVTGEGLAKIAELPGLQHLRLRLSPITDEDLQPLLQCRDLWLINLPHSELTNEGIRSLAELPKLKQLRLGSKKLTDDCCRVITQLEKLRGLHLIGVPVTDNGIKVLVELPHLESLYLDDSAVTDEGWDWVFRNHPQLHVHINQSHHDRDPQSHQH